MKDEDAAIEALAKLIEPRAFDETFGPSKAVSERQDARFLARRILAHGYVLAAEERKRCAELIEANIIVHTNSDDEDKREYLAPRKHGDRLGLFYAESIRALSSQSTKGETE